VLVEVRGVQLPGRTFERFTRVSVGLIVGKEIVDVVAGDVDDARWEVEVRVRELEGGHYDFLGPAVAGRRGDRSLKLAWRDGAGQLFRAAKLRLDRVPPSVVSEALQDDGRLVATVRLTDERGGPTCASVPQSLISWTSEP
jgi:uncharacterized protein DUF5990